MESSHGAQSSHWTRGHNYGLFREAIVLTKSVQTVRREPQVVADLISYFANRRTSMYLLFTPAFLALAVIAAIQIRDQFRFAPTR